MTATATRRTPVAVIGSGNIGTDLMVKVLELSQTLEMAVVVGIDPDSDGLVRAQESGVATVANGVAGFIEHPRFDDVEIVFDATSAAAHVANAAALEQYGKVLVDLTPAALGPYVVPPVNLHEHLASPNLNMVTCGGQATVPVVAAISSVTPVAYAEIVASIASRSAGPGTRANIDEFTETTATALEVVGGAARGRAVIVLNPAEPPLVMRDSVMTLVGRPDTALDQEAVAEAVARMVARVQEYVPGYRLKQEVQFRELDPDEPVHTLLAAGTDLLTERPTHQVSVFLEVEGAGHHLPPYAGNLDIMTSAALRVAESIAHRRAQHPEEETAR